jgi:hypothetical protein
MVEDGRERERGRRGRGDGRKRWRGVKFILLSRTHYHDN